MISNHPLEAYNHRLMARLHRHPLVSNAWVEDTTRLLVVIQSDVELYDEEKDAIGQVPGVMYQYPKQHGDKSDLGAWIIQGRDVDLKQLLELLDALFVALDADPR